MSEERDIIAGFSTGGGHSSGALSAFVSQCCGHVHASERLAVQGYRYFGSLGDEIPAFFNRRMIVNKKTVAMTIQGSTTVTGDDPFEGIDTHEQAMEMLSSPDLTETWWKFTFTIDGALHDIEDLKDPMFLAKNPSVFMAVAEELVALSALTYTNCAMCSSVIS